MKIRLRSVLIGWHCGNFRRLAFLQPLHFDSRSAQNHADRVSDGDGKKTSIAQMLCLILPLWESALGRTQAAAELTANEEDRFSPFVRYCDWERKSASQLQSTIQASSFNPQV
jgi:hypothetical protein